MEEARTEMELPLWTVAAARPWRRRAVLAALAGGALLLRLSCERGAPRRRRLRGGDDDLRTLRWCLVALLSLGAAAHLALAALVVVHRRARSVKAAQPVGQTLVALGGAGALAGGICLAVPPSPLTCSAAAPLILTAATATGASLAGMAWRGERVVTPILRMGRTRRPTGSRVLADGREPLLGRMKRRNAALLTPLAQRSARWSTPDDLRQKVTNRSLVGIVCGLVLPQLVLQVLAATLPALRGGGPGATGDDDPPSCARPAAWPTVVGALLAAWPYASAVLTTSPARGAAAVPAFLCERDALRRVLASFAAATLALAPFLALAPGDPAVSLYVRVGILAGAVLPVTACVVWPKVAPVLLSRPDINVAEEILLATRSGSICRINGQQRFEKARELFHQGQIFEEMVRCFAADDRPEARIQI